MEAAIKNLNEVTESREKMITELANHFGTERGYTKDSQFDRLEAKYSKRSFFDLKNLVQAIRANKLTANNL